MINNDYFKSLDSSLRLVSFKFKGRDPQTDKKIGHPSKDWRETQSVKEGDDSLALVLGEQRDGTYVYCLDFDTSFEEASAVHMDKFEKSNLCFYLEKSLKGGHIIFRTDGKIEACGKKVVYKAEGDHAICEQLGEGQCVYIYPTPEKEKVHGNLNQVFPKHVGEQFIEEVMTRYGYQPKAPSAKPVITQLQGKPVITQLQGKPVDSVKQTVGLQGKTGFFNEAQSEPKRKPTDTSSVQGGAKRGGEGTGLDYFNQNLDLVVSKLEEHGFQLMGEDDACLKFKRPNRKLDGDASIVLFKEATQGKNLRIKTFSHHLNTYDETNSPSMFLQQEGYEDPTSLLRFASEHGYEETLPQIKIVTTKKVKEPAMKTNSNFDPTIPESWIEFNKTSETFSIYHTPAEAIRYGIEHADQKSVYQPPHLFPASPVGRYFEQRNKITLNPQSNGFTLAMFASIASMTARLFRSRHYGTWFDKPAFLSMFLARTASGKDDVLKASRCLWKPFTEGFRKEWEDYSMPKRSVTKKVKDPDGNETETEVKEEYPLIQFLTLDKICSYAGNVEASGPAMAKNVLLKGSHAVLADEIQDQFVKKVNGKYRIVDKSSDLGKMLKEIYTHDETQYDAAECKDESNNVRAVNNPALTLFGTGTPNELFVDYIDKESVEGGLRARLCVWKGWAYTDSRTFNPFEAIRKNRELQDNYNKLEENKDKKDAEQWAYQLGRLYALILLKNAILGKDSDGKTRFDVTKECPPIMIDWEEDAVEDYICYLTWIANEKDLSDDDVAIMNRAQNKFSNLCLLYALSRLALDDEFINNIRCVSYTLKFLASNIASNKIKETLKVNRGDVRNAFKFIVWDVIQMGVLRAQTYDAREEAQVKREEDTWKKIFESSPYELDGEKVVTADWLVKKCDKTLLRDVGLPLRPNDCRPYLLANEATLPIVKSDTKIQVPWTTQKIYVFHLVKEQ